MTSPIGRPFQFQELAGTSWHKRFAAEEFQIFLDHYPEKKIIIDSALSNKELNDKDKLDDYHTRLINYILNNEKIDEKMPIEILKDLRRLRIEVFGIDVFPTTVIRDNLSYDRSDIELRKKLENHLRSVKRILFIPGKPESFKEELSLLFELTEAEIQVVCSNDPLVRGVTEEMFHILQGQKPFSNMTINLDFSFPLHNDGIKRLEIFQNSGVFVFTTNIWVYLEIFRKIKNFGFILNNTEWFSRGLLQSSFKLAGDSLKGFANSGYTEMLLKYKDHNGMTLAGLQTSQFPSEIDASGVQYNALSLSDFLRGKSPESLTLSMGNKINEFNKGNDCITASNGLYRITSNEVINTEFRDPEAVSVSFVTADERCVNAAPLLLDSCKQPEALRISETGILISFNYYFTKNLVEYYNALVSEKEMLRIKDFFIDYLSAELDGKWFETLPLYNKAFLGCTLEGKIFAGHFSLGKVDLFLEDEKYNFTKETINPTGDGSSEGLYLPSSDREFVGKGKYCVVIIQDQIIYRGDGPCRLPPIGAVFVMRDTIPGNRKTVSFRVSWKNLPCAKDRLKWLFGGFNLLVENGKNYYSNLSDADKSLKNEGWKSKASRGTQETQLDPRIRQPRAVFGRTKSGKLLLAQFSGRTNISRGATFNETIVFVQNEIADSDGLDFLINLDGGASASMIGHKNGKYFNFSLTAPSETNPAGVVRPLPAYFSLTQK